MNRPAASRSRRPDDRLSGPDRSGIDRPGSDQAGADQPRAGRPDVRQHILDVARPLLLSKGFTAVGLSELLSAAGVPKGSFYHYFGSKEVFGEAVLEAYFSEYLAEVDALLGGQGTGAERLLRYFEHCLQTQVGDRMRSRCLAVKLGAEVCDLSEPMRIALDRGIGGVVARLADCIGSGIDDGSLPPMSDPAATASTLYQSWFGASLLAKISRDRAPLDAAMAGTRQMLGITGPG